MSADWRIIPLQDGRTVEYLSCEWEPDDGTEPPGTIRMRVYYLLDGVAGTRVVLLSSDDFEAGD